MTLFTITPAGPRTSTSFGPVALHICRSRSQQVTACISVEIRDADGMDAQSFEAHWDGAIEAALALGLAPTSDFPTWVINGSEIYVLARSGPRGAAA